MVGVANRVSQWHCILLIGLSGLCGQSIAADKVLLVGVGEYEQGESWALPGTQNDVDAMHRLFTEQFSIDNKNIKTLRNKEATYKGILNTFDQWLVEGTKPGDRVFFYYSGHGAYIDDVNGDESIASGGDGMDETIVPYDTSCTDDGCKNMILDDDIGERLSQLQDRHVLVMFDSCHSGTVTRNVVSSSEVKSKLFRPPFSTKPELQEDKSKTRGAVRVSKQAADAHKSESGFVNTSSGQVALFAVQPFQQALEVKLDGKPVGLFTNAVVSALTNNTADFNNNGKVSFAELKTSVALSVKQYCEARRQGCGNGVNPLLEIKPEQMGEAVLDFGVKDNVSQVAASGVTSSEVSDILGQDNQANVNITIQPKETLKIGELMRIKVTAEKDGLLFIFDKDANGAITPLYPDPESPENRPDGKPLGWLRAGGSVLIPDTKSGMVWEIEAPTGEGMIFAVLAEHYQGTPVYSKAFEPVVSERNSLGELRVALDQMLDDLNDETLRISPQWSFAMQRYNVTK